MPAAADLAEAIRPLAFLNGKQIRPDPDLKTDMEVLLCRALVPVSGRHLLLRHRTAPPGPRTERPGGQCQC
jgi:hypothetical protein